MNSRRKRLGRGLDALLGPGAQDSGDDGVRAEGELRDLPVEQLQRGRYQPRSDIRAETLESLANSITAQGVVQPIVVRPIEPRADGVRYEIIAGERRWRAAQMAGLREIPAIIKPVPDEAAVAMALIENIQREDLNPLEEARALARLIEEFEMTHQGAADAVGRSRAAVSNMLRLLELSDPVKALVEAGDLEMGHARALLALPAGRQQAAAEQVRRGGLSVRATEQLVRKLTREAEREAAGAEDAAAARGRDPDIRRLETDLAERLGARVSVQHGSRGRGKLVISYHSLDELEGILRHIH